MEIYNGLLTLCLAITVCDILDSRRNIATQISTESLAASMKVSMYKTYQLFYLCMVLAITQPATSQQNSASRQGIFRVRKGKKLF